MVEHARDEQAAAVTGGVGRRAVLARGAAATALVWAAPSVLTTQAAFASPGTPAPDPGTPRTQQTIRLVSSPGADGTADPLVQVLIGGVWRAATAINRPGSYVPLAGTGFVEALNACLNNTTFVFRVPFTLPAGYTGASLTGRTQGDNYVGSVRLNGSASLGGQAPVDSGSAFNGSSAASFGTADPALFVPGTNHLYFDLTNNSCPMALDLEATVTYLA